MSMSAVVMNWARPDNVRRIVEAWQRDGLVEDAIVWNNRPGLSLPNDGALTWARVIEARVDFGLTARFAAALFARHDCVLIQDDDLMISPDGLRSLYANFQQDPDVIHGIFGRQPDASGGYAEHFVQVAAEVDVVLTRGLLVHRKYMADFFARLPEFALEQATPPGNGEDILLSYVVRLASGRRNRVHRVAVRELPAPDAICQRTDHYAHRDRVMRQCLRWFDGR